MSHHESSTVTVEATFHDHVAAEIASALLTDASLLADEPHAIGIKWRVQVSGLTPTMARRAEAILRTAGAIHVQMVVSKPNERHARGDLKLAM
jgi:hypothetical protein